MEHQLTKSINRMRLTTTIEYLTSRVEFRSTKKLHNEILEGKLTRNWYAAGILEISGSFTGIQIIKRNVICKAS